MNVFTDITIKKQYQNPDPVRAGRAFDNVRAGPGGPGSSGSRVVDC